MKKYLYGFLVILLLSGCSSEPSEESAVGGKKVDGQIAGPFPKTITGTIGYSYPLEDGSGRIKLGLLAYDDAEIIISADTYDAKGMNEDDVEVSLTIEPIASEQCGDEKQCFKGF